MDRSRYRSHADGHRRIGHAEKAVISEVEGTVHHGPVVKGMRRVITETDEGTATSTAPP